MSKATMKIELREEDLASGCAVMHFTCDNEDDCEETADVWLDYGALEGGLPVQCPECEEDMSLVSLVVEVTVDGDDF